MKKLIAALVVLNVMPTLPLTAQTPLGKFDDIRFWVGSGSKRSVLVLQWNDGKAPSSLAWGFRWDGEVTGIQMLIAIAGTTIVREPFGGDVLQTLTGADPRLTLVLERYGFGDAIYSLVYNANGTLRTAADWSSGYWQYSLFAGQFDYFTYNSVTEQFDGPFSYNQIGSPNYGAVQWFESQIGASDRLLVDGSWDAWTFAPGFIVSAIAQPVAASAPVPKPDASVRLTNGSTILSVPSQTNFTYQLAFTGIMGGAWTNQPPARQGTGGTISFTNTPPAGTGQRFYQVIVSQ